MPRNVYGYLILISIDFTILLIYFLLNLMLIAKIYQTLETAFDHIFKHIKTRWSYMVLRVWYHYLYFNMNLEFFFSYNFNFVEHFFLSSVSLLGLCILSKPVVHLQKYIFFNFWSSTFLLRSQFFFHQLLHRLRFCT